VLNRVARVTAPHGYLVLGAAETVVGLSDAFKPVPDRRGLYAPVPSASPPGLAARVAAMAPRAATLVAAK